MKLLNWADRVKEKIETKEELLREVERTEIIHKFVSTFTGIMAGIGLVIIVVTPTGCKIAWLGLVIIILASGGYLESIIKSYLKLERYKRIWEKLEQMQGEERKMQAEDL